MVELAYGDKQVSLYQGDVFDCCALLREAGVKVDMICTSPPYWGLRNNSGTERLWIVNDQQRACDHGFEPTSPPNVPVAGNIPGGGVYSGATRWNHVAKEAQESGMKVRDVRPDAWQPTPSKTQSPQSPGFQERSKESGGHGGSKNPYSDGLAWQITDKPKTKMATQGMTQPEKRPMGTAMMGTKPGNRDSQVSQTKHPNANYPGMVVTERAGARTNDSGGGELQSLGTQGRAESSGASICTLCGAWWGSLGLEPTLDCGRLSGELCGSCYVCHVVLICHELRTLLSDHGQFFLNLGDSYIGGKGQSGQGSPEYQALRSDVSFNKPSHQIGGEKLTHPSDRPQPTLKPKDLAMMPAKVGIALTQDGWWLRSQIIWAKGVSFNKKGVEELLQSHKQDFFDIADDGFGGINASARESWDSLEQTLLNNTYVGNAMPESVHGWSFQATGKDCDNPNHDKVQENSCPECWNGMKVIRKLGSGRGTRSYEIIFQLTKTDDDYSDPTAVRESSQPSSLTRYEYPHHTNETDKFPNAPQGNTSSNLDRMGDSVSDPVGRNLRNVWELPDTIWTFPTRGFGWQLCPNCDTVYDPREYKALPKVRVRIDWKTKAQVDSGPVEDVVNHQDGGDTGLDEPNKKGWLEPRICKNCGSPDLADKDGQEISYDVLSKYQMSHYSSFPEALPELAIKFGCPERVCTECERPWARVTVVKKVPHPGRWSKTANAKQNVGKGKGYAETGGLGVDNVLETLGWKPTCSCNASYRPGIVLDPFSGTGTSLVVAKRLGRDGYGFELSEDYCKLASERLRRG